jgi:hypothetical protein
MNYAMATAERDKSNLTEAERSSATLALALEKIEEARKLLDQAHAANVYLREGVAIEANDSGLEQLCDSLKGSIADLDEYAGIVADYMVTED